MGNEGADLLAEQGRLSHPYNLTRFAKRPAFDDDFTRQETDSPSDGGTRDSTDSGSEDYTSGGGSGDEEERFLAQLLGPDGLLPHKRRKP